MSIIQLDNLGNGGIIRDTPPHELPLNAFSDGNNVRLLDDAIIRSLGYKTVLVAPTAAIYHLMPWQDDPNYYWLGGSTQEIFRYTSSAELNVSRSIGTDTIASSTAGAGTVINLVLTTGISYVDGAWAVISGSTGSPNIDGSWPVTRTDDTHLAIDIGSAWVSTHTGNISISDPYSAGSHPIWTGGIFGGVPVMNHTGLQAGDYPQSWDSANDRFQDLPNWPNSSPVWLAKVIRPYKNYLVALYMIEDGVTYPTRLRWSDSADPGTVPTVWVPAATNLAGSKPFSDTNAPLVDCQVMRDVNVVYKEDSVHLMQHVGGIFVFSFRQAFSEFGLLTQRAVKNFFGRHLVVAQGDIVLHDGQQADSIVTKKLRREIFSALSTDNYQSTYVTAYPERNEIWVCIPVNGSGVTSPTRAYIWNWKENAWTVRDLPTMPHIALGIIDESGIGTTFDDLADGAGSGSFDSRAGSFDSRTYNPSTMRLLGSDIGNTIFIKHDDTNQENGSNFTSFVERTGLAINGMKGGTVTVDPHAIKFVRRMYPKITADPGCIVTIKVGGQFYPGGPITWSSYTFDPNSQTYISCRVQGKLLGYRVENTGPYQWKLHSMGFDLDVVGWQ